ncbi:DUF881 domain-containing protein [Brevibacterium samyangense]|uniref:DUF881 domain-containing protein n=1 Tax=Brevibacterium samyangense TaxID=366888 RepID=A0ABP5EFU8_9MICO
MLVLVLCGALMTTSAREASGTQLRNEASTLPDIVEQRSAEADAKQQEVEDLRATVASLQEAAGDEDSEVESARGAVDSAARAASAAEVTGPGVEVTLDDAPRSAREEHPGINPNDLLIHQQDLEAVMNALWAGGATGMAVQGQRIVSTSSVQCVGNTLRVNSQVFSPPYTVTAVGDVNAMNAALAASPQISTYKQYVDRLGLGWKVQQGTFTLEEFDGVAGVSVAQVL